MVTEAIVLAGGLGTRLRSAVPDVPKSMAPIAGQPFLAYLLQFLEANGIVRVLLSVGYRHEVIRDFFGSRFGRLQLAYSVEEEPLGTGGALLRSLALVEGPFTFALNGDTFLRLDCTEMASILERYGDSLVAVALRHVADAGRYGGAVISDGRVVRFHARGTAGPGLINAGCYLVNKDIFRRYPMPEKFSWEQDFLEAKAAEVRPIAFPCDVPFIDIGIPEAFQQAQTLLPTWMHPGLENR